MSSWLHDGGGGRTGGVLHEANPSGRDSIDLRQVLAIEAVTNAARHSGTDEARLELEHDGDDLVVTVRDAGTPAHDRAPGVGVSSMRERSSEVGGTIELTNGQSGSTVRARLPLH